MTKEPELVGVHLTGWGPVKGATTKSSKTSRGISSSTVEEMPPRPQLKPKTAREDSPAAEPPLATPTPSSRKSKSKSSSKKTGTPRTAPAVTERTGGEPAKSERDVWELAFALHEVVAAKPPLVREGFELNSDKVGELPTGTRVTVLEVRAQPDGAMRACIALEGSTAPHGWLTSVTKDGTENIHAVKLPVSEVTAAKPPLVRAAFETSSDKVGELAAGTRIHVLEVRDQPDGSKRAAIALEGTQRLYGWLTSVTKDKVENLRAAAADGGASSSTTPPSTPSPSKAKTARAAPSGPAAEAASSSAVGGAWLWAEIVAAKPPLVRAGCELNSDKVGELPTSTRVLVLEARRMSDGAIRACIALEGQASAHGWLTATTKDGADNLQLLVHEVSASKPPLVRAAFETSSHKVGELAAGTRIHVLEVRDQPDGSKRAAIALEGTQRLYGWLTSVTKEGADNVRPSSHCNAGVVAADHAAIEAAAAAVATGPSAHSKADSSPAKDEKHSAAKAAKAEKEAKLKELKAAAKAEKEANAARIKEEEARKQAEKAAMKEKADREAKERAEKKLQDELDAKKAAAAAMAAKAAAAVKAAAESVAKLKNKRGTGPHLALATAEDQRSKFQEANRQAHAALDPAARDAYKAMRDSGKCAVEVEPMKRNEAHRPHGRPDGAASRHINVPPVSMILMFNCYRAEYRLTMGDITTMPDAEDVPLKSLASLKTLGRVKISPDKGALFMDRVEFANDWSIGDEHGLEHDGLQVRTSRHLPHSPTFSHILSAPFSHTAGCRATATSSCAWTGSTRAGPCAPCCASTRGYRTAAPRARDLRCASPRRPRAGARPCSERFETIRSSCAWTAWWARRRATRRRSRWCARRRRGTSRARGCSSCMTACASTPWSSHGPRARSPSPRARAIGCG